MFHLKLKQLRELKEISQYELAKDLNVAQSTIGMWESKKRQPDHEMLIKIANYFDVTVDYLLVDNVSIGNKEVLFKNNFIGRKLYKLRESRGLTFARLADNLSMSAGHLSDMENGKSLPSIPKLDSICEFYGITLSEFFNESDVPVILDSDQENLISNTKGLNPEQLSLLNKFLESI